MLIKNQSCEVCLAPFKCDNMDYKMISFTFFATNQVTL